MNCGLLFIYVWHLANRGKAKGPCHKTQDPETHEEPPWPAPIWPRGNCGGGLYGNAEEKKELVVASGHLADFIFFQTTNNRKSLKTGSTVHAAYQLRHVWCPEFELGGYCTCNVQRSLSQTNPFALNVTKLFLLFSLTVHAELLNKTEIIWWTI